MFRRDPAALFDLHRLHRERATLVEAIRSGVIGLFGGQRGAARREARALPRELARWRAVLDVLEPDPLPTGGLAGSLREALRREADEVVQRHDRGDPLVVWDLVREIPDLLLHPEFHPDVIARFRDLLVRPRFLRTNTRAASGSLALTDSFFEHLACTDVPVEAQRWMRRKLRGRRFLDPTRLEAEISAALGAEADRWLGSVRAAVRESRPREPGPGDMAFCDLELEIRGVPASLRAEYLAVLGAVQEVYLMGDTSPPALVTLMTTPPPHSPAWPAEGEARHAWDQQLRGELGRRYGASDTRYWWQRVHQAVAWRCREMGNAAADVRVPSPPPLPDLAELVVGLLDALRVIERSLLVLERYAPDRSAVTGFDRRAALAAAARQRWPTPRWSEGERHGGEPSPRESLDAAMNVVEWFADTDDDAEAEAVIELLVAEVRGGVQPSGDARWEAARGRLAELVGHASR